MLFVVETDPIESAVGETLGSAVSQTQYTSPDESLLVG